ncbi:HD domain-containing protein [candidate division WOR-3 bacterium]|nr:HD domain-containing protein [candidate division WOR-3 bacterium]
MRETERILVEVLKLLAETVDAKDHYTKGHSERVRGYATVIGQKLGLSEKEVKLLAISAELHDIGKAKVMDEILKKPSHLNHEETLEIYRHPIYSFEITKDLPGFEEVANILLYHHEYFNGSGYPFGLSGEKIPMLSRIITVADVFDAMTSKRVYRKRRYSDKEALNYLKNNSGKLFDPDVVKAFLSAYEEGLIFMERGNYYYNHNIYPRALKHYREALKAMKDEKMIYEVKMRIAEIYNRQRNFDTAIKILRDGLKSNNPYLGIYYLELSNTYYYMDELNKMKKYVEKALKENLSFTQKIRAMRHLIIYHHRKGNPEKSLELYRKIELMIDRYYKELRKEKINIYDIPEQINIRTNIDIEKSRLYDIVGRVMRDLGFLNEGINFFEKSIEIKTLLGDFIGKSISLSGLGETYLLMEDYETAYAVTLESLSLSKMINNNLGIYLSHLKLLEIASLMGDFKTAEKHLKFLTMYRKKVFMPDGEQRFNLSKGIYFFSKGDYRKAETLLKLVEKESKNKYRKSLARLYIARIYKNKGDKKNAEKYYKECIKMLKHFRMECLLKSIEEELKNV